jgi:hypothetical protein
MMPHDEQPRGTNDAALGDPVDIRRRVKDHARIILQHPDPARDVRDVLPTVVADAELLAQHQPSHLGGKRFRRSSPRRRCLPRESCWTDLSACAGITLDKTTVTVR